MPETRSISDSLLLIRNETAALLERTAAEQQPSLDALAELISAAPRVFIHGAGRSGLALRMTAMRLMHLGLQVHIVGDTTTPAIRAGEVLLTASGSGTTAGVLRAAEEAKGAGADIAAITADAASPLAELATVAVLLSAATKSDRSAQASDQYAGSLFEQGVALLGDALFHGLWSRSHQSADDLWPRHANLE